MTLDVGALAVARRNARRVGALAAPGHPRVALGVLRAGAFAVVSLVGVAEGAQTLAAFFGSEQLLWYHQDFPAFYAAAHLVAHGSGHAIYDTAAIAAAEIEVAGQPVGGTGLLAYFNPPFFALAMTPLTLVSMDRAYQIWTLLGVALLAVDAWILWRLAAVLSRPARVLLVLAFVTLFPVSYGLQQGQFSLILATSWGATFLLLRRGHDRWAGIALAPLLIKPELLLPVAAYLVWQRRWPVFSTLLPCCVAAVAISVVVVGIPGAVHYPAYVLQSTTWDGDGVTARLMFSWNGLVAMFHDEPGSLGNGIALVALAVPTVAAVGYAARGPAEARSPQFATQWLVLTIATILVDPHFYLQDTIIVAIPAAALLCCMRPEHRGRGGCALAAGWLLLALGTFPNEHLHADLFGLYLVGAGAVVVGMGARGYGKRAPLVTPWFVSSS